MFSGRKLLIATQHRKEEVIAPLLVSALGVKCQVAEALDTDQLGTFTGEVARLADPVTTARTKCQMAMDLYHCDLAVANEGSFGPDPVTGLVSMGDETMVLLDKRNGLEITVRHVSLDTNFAGAALETEEELLQFANQARFPSHGLILRPSQNSANGITKGIKSKTHLLTVFRELKQTHKTVFAETDMRAMHNPTRMAAIKQLTFKLVTRAVCSCPQCQTPGFGISKVNRGLPCGWCGSPTRSVLSVIYGCLKCGFTALLQDPFNRKTEDPGNCQNCNP